MLPKKLRLRERDFPQQTKVTFKGELLDLRRDGAGDGTAGVAVVVGKRVSSKATTRNALRRLIYDALRVGLGDSTPAGRVLVVLKQPVATLGADTKAAIKTEIHKALQQK